MYGYPETRIEAAMALAGTATANAMGAKYKPTDLIPIFERKRLTAKQMKVAMDCWAESINNNVKHK